MLPSLLDEFMWRERHDKADSEVFVSLIRDIMEQYCV